MDGGTKRTAWRFPVASTAAALTLLVGSLAMASPTEEQGSRPLEAQDDPSERPPDRTEAALALAPRPNPTPPRTVPTTVPTTAPATPVPATNGLGLRSTGEFVVDPAVVVADVPGWFSPVPEDPQGRYRFGIHPTGGGVFEPALVERRCLQPPLASAVANIAVRFAQLFGGDGLHLVVGEGNSGVGHATHYGGAYVDLYTNLGNADTERFVERDGAAHPAVAAIPYVRSYLDSGGRLGYEESVALWLAMAIIDSGQFGRIVFELDRVNELARAYAAARGQAFRAEGIRHTGNRTHFYHLHLEAEPEGSSRTCRR